MTEATWSRPVASTIGLLVAYYAVPLDWSSSPAVIGFNLALTGFGLALLAWMMVQELQHVRHGRGGRSVGILTLMLILLVMSFSFTFYLMNLLDPEQISGLDTRTDALYFTLSTMATVGYGDVHAEGQLARALVCGLIVFNIVVVASLVRAYARVGQPRV